MSPSASDTNPANNNNNHKTLLPHEASDMFFLTDGGMETVLVFHEGIELPLFSSSIMVRNDKGKDWLREYYRTYMNLAATEESGRMGFILESVTWRASQEWCDKLGYAKDEYLRINKDAVELLVEVASEYPELNVVKSGAIGPRGDGYSCDKGKMTADEAEAYHEKQIQVLKDAGVDLVGGFTLNYVEEAMGIVRAAKRIGVPSVISFTLETNGCLPSGETMSEAIAAVDDATDGGPAYYMVNCAHPTHYMPSFAAVQNAESNNQSNNNLNRIRGIRSNASKCSHAELDEAEKLDDGDPIKFGQEHAELLQLMPQINILGGCCGTDHRHVEQICKTCAPLFRQNVDRN